MAMKRHHEGTADDEGSPKKQKISPIFLEKIRQKWTPKKFEHIVSRALGLTNEIPNTLNALYNLFDSSSFSFTTEPIKSKENIIAGHRVTLNIEGQLYTGVNSTVKAAKASAAKKALEDLFPEIEKKYKGCASDCSTIQNTELSFPTYLNVRMTFSDIVSFVITSKFNEIMVPYSATSKKFSVLSGIVRIDGDDLNTMSVICISTGTKCVQGDQMSKRGDVLFDCHAEILGKRCLKRYLYSQLYQAVNSEDSIFRSVNSMQYCIKSNIRFYLYISSSPCGDGRVYNFSALNEKNKIDSNRGILRVKLESGMGAIPVTRYSDDPTPTYNDYLRGKPFITMCCSEKLLLTNVLGMQGSLLSHFIDAIYLSGVIIGDDFEKENVTRALYGRMKNFPVKEILYPYRLNCPIVDSVSCSTVVTNVRSYKLCLNWIVSDPKVEFLNTKTGKTLEGNRSRLCKLSMFEKYLKIHTLLTAIDISAASKISYLGYKENAITYQKIKRIILKYLEDNSYGKWIQKSREFDSFLL